MLCRIVAPQPTVGAVFDCGGDEVEAFDELCDGSVAEIVGERKEFGLLDEAG